MYFSENSYINPVYSRSEISHTLIRFHGIYMNPIFLKNTTGNRYFSKKSD